MHPSRRRFLRHCGLATTGAILAPAGVISPLAHGKTPKKVSFSAAEGEVIEFVKSYALRVKVTGEAVLARWHERTPSLVRIIAEVADVSVIGSVWANASLTTDGIYADGNTMSFSY